MISGQVPQHLVIGAKVGFLSALKDTPQQWSRIANMFQMSAKSVDLVDLGAAPMPVQSRSGTTVQDFIEKTLTVEPLDWDITVFISHNAIQDDQTDALLTKVRGAGQNFNKHLDKLVFQALNAGGADTYGLCYDGQNFFDTDHVDKGGKYQTAQSNKTTAALDLNTFETARVAQWNFLDDQGEITNNVPSLLVVPPAYERKGSQIATNPNDYMSGDLKTNPYNGTVSLLVSPYLDATSWYVIAGNETAKPIYLAMREMPNLLNTWFDPYKPEGGWYGFKFYARYNVFYGDWRLAFEGNT